MIVEIQAPTLISEGTRVKGSLTFCSATQVFGLVEGEVHQETLETLHIGRTGWVTGGITAQGPIVVEGRVDGDVHSLTRVRLLPTAVVLGEIHAPTVEIRNGAFFEGSLKMRVAA